MKHRLRMPPREQIHAGPVVDIVDNRRRHHRAGADDDHEPPKPSAQRLVQRRAMSARPERMEPKNAGSGQSARGSGSIWFRSRMTDRMRAIVSSVA